MSPEAREKLDILVEIFREYERSLKSDNALDFDDLLIYGLDLVKRFPRVVEKIKTVLIDEVCTFSLVELHMDRSLSSFVSSR